MQTIILLLTVVSLRLAHSVYSIFVVGGEGGAISKPYPRSTESNSEAGPSNLFLQTTR